MAEAQHATAEAPPGRRDDGNQKGPKRSFLSRVPVIVIGTLALSGLIFFGLSYLVESFTHESTDDAFLDADFVSIAPRVSGQVKTVHVASNQRIQAGEALLDLDSRDLEVAVEQKEAALKAAQANVQLVKASVDLFRTQIESAKATAKQSEAEAAASQATSENAQAELQRAQSLMTNHTISAQEFDTARAVATAAEANLRAAHEKANSDKAKVDQAQAQFEAGIKGYERAQAQTVQSEADLKAAQLNLSYAHITAPIAGYVTKKSVADGEYVQIGQKLMVLVPENLYVTANFKETQLKDLRTNQPASIKIDSVESGPLAGHVQSIMAGSGSRFSLLPPENAVGNFIKVVQRVPVKILFDAPLEAGHVLGPGMSVVPSVRVASFELSEGACIAIAVGAGLVLGFLWWSATRRSRNSS
jgi:membrane fusion protein (multidrug efflux system)